MHWHAFSNMAASAVFRKYFISSRLMPYLASRQGRNTLYAIYGKQSFYCSTSVAENSSTDEQVTVLGKSYKTDSMTNITANIISKTGRKLHNCADHPLRILKEHIQKYLYTLYRTRWGAPVFTMVDDISPVVTVEQNFDSLLVAKDHVSRSKNDNYYINKDTLLRAHTTAHERDLLKMGLDGFVLTGDVYRRDEIDRTHYPVFHQMEGVRIFTKHDLFANHEDSMDIFSNDSKRTNEKQEIHSLEAVKLVEFNLKETLTGLVEHLCGKDTESRWVDAYFPFTHPSWELEIKFRGEWMELVGSGVLEHDILTQAGAGSQIGWAFGIGLERLAMKLFDIPDIRLFWSQDERFLSQFRENRIVQFKPFSKYPPTYKDVSFWISDQYSPNNFYEVVRMVAGDIAEKVDLIDKFVHPETGRESHCYRITYRSMEKTFRDEEVNKIQDFLREELERKLRVQLR